MDEHVPDRLFPGDPTPELPSFDDDWLRLYYDPPYEPDKLQIADSRIRYMEIHELGCTRLRCDFRPWDKNGCPFHPPGCRCSMGACQE